MISLSLPFTFHDIEIGAKEFTDEGNGYGKPVTLIEDEDEDVDFLWEWLDPKGLDAKYDSSIDKAGDG